MSSCQFEIYKPISKRRGATNLHAFCWKSLLYDTTCLALESWSRSYAFKFARWLSLFTIVYFYYLSGWAQSCRVWESSPPRYHPKICIVANCLHNYFTARSEDLFKRLTGKVCSDRSGVTVLWTFFLVVHNNLCYYCVVRKSIHADGLRCILHFLMQCFVWHNSSPK